ncbi:MAG: tetratricopeptide repeat protein, partial [Myxococcales bacterium]|nr:tetratricopeptide repeat protein [Myxococcales bacterium]
YQRALAVLEDSLGPEHPDVASARVNLGNLLYQQERLDEAWLHYERAYEIQRKALSEDHPFVAWSQLGLAKVALAQDRFDVAREHAERAVAIREGTEVPPGLLAEARFMLARALWSDPAGRSRARALATQAREGWASTGADDELTKDYLARVEQWLTEHPLP